MLNNAVLIIYTGGTIGMVEDPRTGALHPLNFDSLQAAIPEIARFSFHIDSESFTPPLDSANVSPDFWITLADIIASNYGQYDGFVVLHGTDTMAYTASALSFMLENLNKPVILTGSQLPISSLRTDAKENLLTSLEIASARIYEKAVVPEVCIYFENKLFRGNRTTKVNSENFNAFKSGNHPALAEAGVHIKYNFHAIRYPADNARLMVHRRLDTNIAILKLFPGMNPQYVRALLNTEGLRAVVLETFGAGNAPSLPWFLDEIKSAIDRGIIIVNVSQCQSGSVDQAMYDTGRWLRENGVVGGYDSTTEATVTKLMYLLGRGFETADIIYSLNKSLVGEITLI